MIKKISAFFLACAFVLNGVGMIVAAPENEPAAIDRNDAQTSPLAALLPASDGVITVNMLRVVRDALPQVLSSNQLMLNEILGKLDEVKAKTGIDLRQFEQIAVGVSPKIAAPQKVKVAPIILARGTLNAGALLALAKVGANGKYREEKIGDRAVYVFSPKQIVAQNKPQTTNPNGAMHGKIVSAMFDRLPDEIAVAAYDANTLAIGSLARLRQTFAAGSRVAPDVLNLVSRKPNALMSFGMNLPNGLSPFIPLENDELGKNLDAIRQISGAVDVGGTSATASVIAKMVGAAQAKDLSDTLSGFQMIGKAFFGGAKTPQKQLYSRLIDNAKIAQSGSEVSIDLLVPQSDIDILVGAK